MAGPQKEVRPNLKKDTKNTIIDGRWAELMAISNTLLFYIFYMGTFDI
jgi:hypothetical protein